jgi:hypothetical protein
LLPKLIAGKTIRNQLAQQALFFIEITFLMDLLPIRQVAPMVLNALLITDLLFIVDHYFSNQSV